MSLLFYCSIVLIFNKILTKLLKDTEKKYFKIGQTLLKNYPKKYQKANFFSVRSKSVQVFQAITLFFVIGLHVSQIGFCVNQIEIVCKFNSWDKTHAEKRGFFFKKCQQEKGLSIFTKVSFCLIQFMYQI